MPLFINSRDDIRETLISEIGGRTDDLTDFVGGSAEWEFLDAQAEYHYRQQHARVAAQLSGWVQYAGGPVTKEDIRDLYPPNRRDPVDLDLLNYYVSPYDLDQIGIKMGVDRDPGFKASGEVIITLSGVGGRVEQGTRVATVPDEGDYLIYEVVPEKGDEIRAPEGQSDLIAPIRAIEIGDGYNVASNTVEYVPPGQERAGNIIDVTNPNAIDGGVDEEKNGPYRQRISEALTHASQGGTEDGIEGAVQNNIDGVSVGDVLVKPYHDETRTVMYHDREWTIDYSADVVVNGGTDATTMVDLDDGRTVEMPVIQELVDRRKPTAIIHKFIRPYIYEIDANVLLAGDDADPQRAANAVADYLSDLTLGEHAVDTRLIQLIRNEDSDIVDVELDLTITGEPHEFVSGTSAYELRSSAPENGIVSVNGTNGGADTTFTAGTDFSVVTNAVGQPTGIDFSGPSGGSSPDTGTTFYISYETDGDVVVRRDEAADPGQVTASVSGGGEATVE